MHRNATATVHRFRQTYERLATTAVIARPVRSRTDVAAMVNPAAVSRTAQREARGTSGAARATLLQRFVARSIRTIPGSTGTVQTPEETLRSRCGTALDAAILLASLLAADGTDTTLAIGTLQVAPDRLVAFPRIYLTGYDGASIHSLVGRSDLGIYVALQPDGRTSIDVVGRFPGDLVHSPYHAIDRHGRARFQGEYSVLDLHRN